MQPLCGNTIYLARVVLDPHRSADKERNPRLPTFSHNVHCLGYFSAVWAEK